MAQAAQVPLAFIQKGLAVVEVCAHRLWYVVDWLREVWPGCTPGQPVWLRSFAPLRPDLAFHAELLDGLGGLSGVKTAVDWSEA